MSHTTFPDTGIVLADTDVVGDVVADFVAAAALERALSTVFAARTR